MGDVDTHEFVEVAGLLDGAPVVFDAVVFEVHYETIRSDLPELDPGWKYVDKNGHGHFVVEDPKDRLLATHDRLPTLEWVITDTYWCEEHHEEHDEGEYQCRVCHEPIEPGKRPFTPRRMLMGRSLKLRLSGTVEHLAEHTVQIGRDTFLCRESERTLDHRGGSVTLTGVPKPEPVEATSG